MINREEIIDKLLHNMHIVRQEFMAGCATKKELAITPSQGFVLRLVAKNNAASVKMVAETLRISSSAATQLIDGLVENGYLLRAANLQDKRVSSLTLSDKARELFEEFQAHREERMKKFFSPLSDEELLQYAALNKKITDRIVEKKL